MTTFQDLSIGWSNESTYKTYVAPAIHTEFIDETLDWQKGIVNGKGLRVGSRVLRSTRRVYHSGMGSGDVSMQIATKGLGKLWGAATGSGTSTLVAGSTYQQNFVLGDAPNSLTVQKGTVEVGATVDPVSFLGCMVTDFEIASPNRADVTAKFTFDIGDYTTAQSYVTPAYPSSVSVFNWGQATVSLGGTLTAPTTTALGSVAGPTTVGIRSFDVKVKRNLAIDRFNYGASGRKSKPTVGMTDISGSVVVEYDGTTIRDAFLGDTDQTLVATFTGATALSTGFEQFQVVLPTVRLEGALPKSNAGDLIQVTHNFTALDNTTTAQPIWIVQRTADTAL